VARGVWIDRERFHVYLSHVQGFALSISRTSLGVIAFGITTCLLQAADQPSSAPHGYKLTTVDIGGKQVQVQEYDPYSNTKAPPPSDGKYHPDEMNFNATSSMSEKKFGVANDALPKRDADLQNSDKNAFVTKSYTDAAFSSSQADFNTKAKVSSTNSFSRSATGMDKSYATSAADADQSKPALYASSKSSDEDRTATIGDRKADTFSSTMGDKTFRGPEADAAHHHLSKLANGQMLVTDLPDRPMTIDEVRNLINHGFKPATDVKPDEPTKALNDPNYAPDPMREMPPDSLNDLPSPAPASDDDKNDAVPPPGTMSVPPENSEPLPQH
jgi:hypothetical protein